jgi:hypothetical protein
MFIHTLNFADDDLSNLICNGDSRNIDGLAARLGPELAVFTHFHPRYMSQEAPMTPPT